MSVDDDFEPRSARRAPADEEFEAKVARAIYQREVALLPFKAQDDGRRVSWLKGGKVVLVDKARVEEVGDGEWWFVRLDERDKFAIAHPIARFSPEGYFEARPEERGRLVQAVTQPQGLVAPPGAERPGPRVEPPADTHRKPVLLRAEGTLELRDFAHLFPAEAEVMVDKRRGIVALRPAEGGRGFPVEGGIVVVRSLAQRVELSGEEQACPAWWDDRRGLLMIEVAKTEAPQEA